MKWNNIDFKLKKKSIILEFYEPRDKINEYSILHALANDPTSIAESVFSLHEIKHGIEKKKKSLNWLANISFFEFLDFWDYESEGLEGSGNESFSDITAWEIYFLKDPSIDTINKAILKSQGYRERIEKMIWKY